ncbi:unnamed protein product [Adineta ricciae]|uniref:EF-hand domain-containing protein n=1 Tax=Adineta ricciae TaxID=249248 RepID=A0A815DKB1_ADIRI|nr:unnamed protein product [Adineta ricciae]
MNDEDILYWFQTFHRDCPDGLLTQQVFIQFYKQAFHDGDPTKFCKRIFHIFDRDKSGRSCSTLDRFYKLVFTFAGTIDFMEFLLAIDLFENGSLYEKLYFAFHLYDLDGNGILTRTEIVRLIKMILSVRGETTNEQTKQTILAHLNAFLKHFDVNTDEKISLEEFCTICEKDEVLKNFLSVAFST